MFKKWVSSITASIFDICIDPSNRIFSGQLGFLQFSSNGLFQPNPFLSFRPRRHLLCALMAGLYIAIRSLR